jgi:Short C-terminal domain
MARLPNVPRHVDRGILLAASVAVRSPKLTPAEKRELRTHIKKHGGRGAARSGWSMADRARCVWLVRKALPEALPGRPKPGSPDGVLPPGRPYDVDPLERLEKLAALHERGVLTDAEFTREKQKILGAPPD